MAWNSEGWGEEPWGGAAALVIPGTFVWLEYDNFITVQHAYGEGRIGEWERGPSIGYSQETFCKFDVSGLNAGSIKDVYIEIISDSKGAQLLSAPSFIKENDKVPASTWEGLSRPPKYDDFPITDVWPNVTDETTVINPGIYDYASATNSLRQIVIDWIYGSKQQDDGLIVDANFQALGSYLDITSINLVIEVSDDVFLHNIMAGVSTGIMMGVC